MPPKTSQVHPVKLWLLQRKRTQVWLAERLDVTPNYIWLVFERRMVPSNALLKAMSNLTRGEVSFEELKAFHSRSPKKLKRSIPGERKVGRLGGGPDN